MHCPDILQSEINHLRRALGRCDYPNWVISRVQHKVLNNNWEGTSNNHPSNPTNNTIQPQLHNQETTTTVQHTTAGQTTIITAPTVGTRPQ